MSVFLDAGLNEARKPRQPGAAHRIEMSSHLFPEVSAHLLGATPTRHWLEWVDWANAIVEEPLRVEGGFAVVPERPGNGLTWDKTALEKYRM